MNTTALAPTAVEDADAHESGIVTCRLGESEFGFALDSVQEVVRYPRITPVPFAPSYVAGVTNLRGNLLPVIDVRARFGLAAKERADTDRIVVVNLRGVPTGLVVDSVREVMHLGSEEQAEPPAAVQGIERRFVRSVVRRDDGKRLILVLDHQQILDAPVSSGPPPSALEAQALEEGKGETQVTIDSDDQVVAFRLGNEEFGLPIAAVQEIIRVPAIVAVPQAPSHVLGVANLRGRVFSVVSLRRWFGLSTTGEGDSNERCVVARLGGHLVALKVDQVLGVLRLPASAIEKTPELAGHSGSGLHGVCGVAKLDQGKRLVLLLDEKALLQVTNAVGNTTSASANETKELLMESADERQMVSFTLGDAEFGIAIQEVQEIIRLTKVTAVPRSPAYVEGMVNLRGEVLPVVDLRKRMGLPAKPVSDATRVVVVDLKGAKAGLIVDAVREVTRIASRDLAPAPGLVAGAEREIIEGVARLNQGERMILVVRPDKLLNAEEFSHFTAA